MRKIKHLTSYLLIKVHSKVKYFIYPPCVYCRNFDIDLNVSGFGAAGAAGDPRELGEDNDEGNRDCDSHNRDHDVLQCITITTSDQV